MLSFMRNIRLHVKSLGITLQGIRDTPTEGKPSQEIKTV